MNGTQVQTEKQPGAAMAWAASASAATSPLSPTPVLSAGDVLYPATDALAAPLAGAGSLGQQQLATPTTAGVGTLHLTQT